MPKGCRWPINGKQIAPLASFHIPGRADRRTAYAPDEALGSPTPRAFLEVFPAQENWFLVRNFCRIKGFFALKMHINRAGFQSLASIGHSRINAPGALVSSALAGGALLSLLWFGFLMRQAVKVLGLI